MFLQRDSGTTIELTLNNLEDLVKYHVSSHREPLIILSECLIIQKGGLIIKPLNKLNGEPNSNIICINDFEFMSLYYYKNSIREYMNVCVQSEKVAEELLWDYVRYFVKRFSTPGDRKPRENRNNIMQDLPFELKTFNLKNRTRGCGYISPIDLWLDCEIRTCCHKLIVSLVLRRLGYETSLRN